MTGLAAEIRNIADKFTYLLRNGVGPRVLCQYLADVLHYRLVRQGIPRGRAKEVAQIRAAFEADATKGRFDKTWFDGNIVPWCVTFSRVFRRETPVRILEIGSFQGRSSLFFLTYFTHGNLTAVDTWAGSDEHEGDASLELETLEARFDGNVAPCATRLTKRRGSSLQVLPQLLDEKQEFDVIYVDGSHLADDVLTDGITAWRLLKKDGVLIFDDLTWRYYPRAQENPAWAIKAFLQFHKGKYQILSVADQLILQKTVSW
jgi:predicted O-methyltransferase YrrM